MQFNLWLLGDETLSLSNFQDALTIISEYGEISGGVNKSEFNPPVSEISIGSELDFKTLKSRLQKPINEAGFDFILKLDDWQHVFPKLIIMDMDSTLVQAETIDQIAKHAGVMAEVSAITESAMRGELDFTQSLLKRVSMLKGITEQQLLGVHYALPLTSGAESLINAANQNDCYTVLVSGGFTYFAQPIADRIGIQEVHANVLEFEQGCLTGRVTGDIVDAQYKQTTLERLISERDIKREETIAIGDGANDLLMLAAAGTGVAFHGKPKVQAESQAALNVYGLDAINWWLGW